ncbi:MAG: PQQ-binding-like beta-propeller repeat protein [bacterium]|nr:PQQ-binding-like beta-propeller repeat protein [bacterium]
MGTNSYVKPLKAFDPKKNLLVNEGFKLSNLHTDNDPFGDLEEDYMTEAGDDIGKEFCSMKTGSAIKAGVVPVENAHGKTIFLTGNKAGEVYLLQLENNELKKIMSTRISGSIIRTPAYADGVIYCTTREGNIFALKTGLEDKQTDIRRGIKPKVLWKHQMKKGILTQPVATGRILIIASLGGIFGYEAYYKNETDKAIGRPLWARSINGVVSTPRIDSGIIYIGSEDKHVYAFDYGGSKVNLVWSSAVSAQVRAQPCLTQKDNGVMVPTLDGFVYWLDRKTGKSRWWFIVKSAVYSSIVSTIIGGKEYFYFGADNGTFYCINDAGKKVWEFKTNARIRAEAVIQKDRIYFGSEDNNLYALDVKTGKEVFKYSTDGNINSAPLVMDDLVFFGSSDSFVHGVHL